MYDEDHIVSCWWHSPVVTVYATSWSLLLFYPFHGQAAPQTASTW